MENPDVEALLDWCSGREPGRPSRLRRVPALFNHFADLVRGPWATVTVTGTSGKGSTCALIDAMLAADGHVTGVFTSPHLVSYRERIRVANRPVSDEELSDHIRRLFPRFRAFVAAHGPASQPSFFESLLVVACAIFRDRGVTAAVFEAAVGGSNDAASFLPADVSVLTAVGLDHCNELGGTVEEIATDKAGLAPAGGILVLGAGLAPEAREAAIGEAGRRGVRVVRASAEDLEIVRADVRGQVVRVGRGDESRRVSLPFPGDHQVLNLATARACLHVLGELGHLRGLDRPLDPTEVRAALPGRFEFVDGAPAWLLDVAHNPLSWEALAATVRRFLRRDDVVAVVGVTEPHDDPALLSAVGGACARIAFCEGFYRALPADELARLGGDGFRPFRAFRSPEEAVDEILADGPNSGQIFLITGSLFLVGRWRRALEGRGLIGPRSEHDGPPA